MLSMSLDIASLLSFDMGFANVIATFDYIIPYNYVKLKRYNSVFFEIFIPVYYTPPS